MLVQVTSGQEAFTSDKMGTAVTTTAPTTTIEVITTTTPTATTLKATTATETTPETAVNVSGHVTGGDGLPVPNASVYLKQGAVVYHALCDESGNYSFDNESLTAGYYMIYASAELAGGTDARSPSSSVLISVGSNTFDLQISGWVYVTPTPTPTPEPEPEEPAELYDAQGNPIASIYVNGCRNHNSHLIGISWAKSGDNGQWLPLHASGLRLSGNTSHPTRLNITQFPSLGWPDKITLSLAGEDLYCSFELQWHDRFEINMCDCVITQDVNYDY